MSQLTPAKQKRLAQLELIIEKGLATTAEVFAAIREIRDSNLYVQFGSWEEYCEMRWKKSANQVNLIYRAVPIMEAHPEVKSINAAVALSKVPVRQRKEVIGAIKEQGEDVTAPAIQKASVTIPVRKPIAPVQKPKPPVIMDSGKKDSTGLEIPRETINLWNQADGPGGPKELLSGISRIRSALQAAQESGNPLFVEIDFNQDLANLNQVYVDLKRAIPFAVCHSCQGKVPDTCTVCKGRGYVSQFYWEHCVPQEIKDLRK